MARTKQEPVTFRLTKQPLDHGPAEERAGFGQLEIVVNGRLMTEGYDEHIQGYAAGPLVSGYHFAEWLVWNWWRLRWEPGPPATSRRWDTAHHTATIGEGYVWPNVVISSDGFRCAVVAEPSQEARAVPYRYLGAVRMEVVAAGELEIAIDRFARQILDLIDSADLRTNNLRRLWDDLSAERNDPYLARFRRLEARLGFDPDEIDEGTVVRHLDDAEDLGDYAVDELAAHAAHLGMNMVSASELRLVSMRHGFDASTDDAIQLSLSEQDWTENPAWKIGEGAARAIRIQESIGFDEPISNSRLAHLAGTATRAIENISERSDTLSFFIAEEGQRSRVALRPKWETGRRFDLARLIGDRLFDGAEPLSPATQTYSYRQKAQRAFAVELLSPYDAVNDMLGTDTSEERQTEIADHFQVSPLTIWTMLENKGRISRQNALFLPEYRY